jgi:hypothetical protein
MHEVKRVGDSEKIVKRLPEGKEKINREMRVRVEVNK